MISATLTTNIETGAKKRIRTSTEIVETDGGWEERNRRWLYPKHQWDCTVEPQPRDGPDYAATVNLFYAADGAFETFLLHDWSDDSVTLAAFGTGDGVTTVFQLYKPYTAGATTRRRKITRPVATPLIYVSGVLSVSASVDLATGLVTFGVAPANAAPLTWTGEFRVPVRFEQDTLEITALVDDSDEGLLQIEPFTVVEVRE